MSNSLFIMLGSPGSGKGTQSVLLAEKKGLFHLEASRLLESKFKDITTDKVMMGEEEFSLAEQRRRWEEGLLCEDGFVAYVVKEKLKKTEKSVVMDGYPRSTKQIDSLLPFLKEKFSKITAFYVVVDEDESIYRNSNRRVCELMRHSIITHPETLSLTICPIDGSPLKKRGLDDPEVIRVRLKEFEKLSFPVVDYLKKNGIEVKEIDGKGSIADVFSRILETWR